MSSLDLEEMLVSQNKFYLIKSLFPLQYSYDICLKFLKEIHKFINNPNKINWAIFLKNDKLVQTDNIYSFDVKNVGKIIISDRTLYYMWLSMNILLNIRERFGETPIKIYEYSNDCGEFCYIFQKFNAYVNVNIKSYNIVSSPIMLTLKQRYLTMINMTLLKNTYFITKTTFNNGKRGEKRFCVNINESLENFDNFSHGFGYFNSGKDFSPSLQVKVPIPLINYNDKFFVK